MKFRKKPVVIEAYQTPLRDQYAGDFIGWARDVGFDWRVFPDRPLKEEDYGCFFVATLEGIMRAIPGDWIIKGVEGEFYPCRNDIFQATYEPVED